MISRVVGAGREFLLPPLVGEVGGGINNRVDPDCGGDLSLAQEKKSTQFS